MGTKKLESQLSHGFDQGFFHVFSPLVLRYHGNVCTHSSDKNHLTVISSLSLFWGDDGEKQG